MKKSSNSGLGEENLRKNLKQKILWHCLYKDNILEGTVKVFSRMSTPADVEDQVQVELLTGTSNLKIQFLLRSWSEK
jgi:hypothetical protein